MVSASDAKTLSAYLRQQTRALHHLAEALVPLTGGRLTGEGYIAHLRVLWPVVWAMERSLLPWRGALRTLWHDEGPLRDRAPLVHQDIEALTGAALPPSPKVAPELSRPVGSLHQAVGRWYVLGGSRMGGQVIRKELQRVLGRSSGPGYSYYGASCTTDSTHFRAFIAAIDRRHDFWLHRHDIGLAAGQTFAHFCRAFAQAPPNAMR